MSDLISREALKDIIEYNQSINSKLSVYDVLKIIDNAPTVAPQKVVTIPHELIEKLVLCVVDTVENIDWDKAIEAYKERPQGEREFIEILAQNVPEDLCTYPEYKGKPYYSIHYKEKGEDFVGFGTYNPEVLSRYLRDYFMKGGAKCVDEDAKQASIPYTYNAPQHDWKCGYPDNTRGGEE